MLSTGSSIAIWKISLRFFSPPEKPTLTSLLANSGFIPTKAIFSLRSLMYSPGLISSSPSALRRALRAAFIKLVIETPGISTGYWKLRKMPAQDLSSGLIASRSLPRKKMLPELTLKSGLPESTEARVLFPAPFGPAWTSPSRMTRFTPLRISFPSIPACRSLISSKISFIISNSIC